MATHAVDVDEIQTTRGEKGLAVVLAVFILIGLVWAYDKLDRRDNPEEEALSSERLSAAVPVAHDPPRVAIKVAGFEDNQAVIEGSAVGALVQGLDADRGPRCLESFVRTALSAATGGEGVERAEALVLQAFPGGEDPVVVPARQQFRGVEYRVGGSLGLVVVDVRADQQFGALAEPVDVDDDLGIQGE